MRLAGSRTVPAAPAEVWAFLLTPGRLRRCLPGCERFEATGPDTFSATMRLGVAFFKGKYSGTIRVLEQQPPERLALLVEGRGALGSLAASGTLTFAAAGGGTILRYDGEAQVRGAVASAGERVIAATADRLIGLFFDCMSSQLVRREG